MATPTLAHNTAGHRYEIAVDGKLAGFAEYELSGGTTTFTHTEIQPGYEGQGLASKLARFALDDVRAQGGRAVAQCEFIAGYIGKHPEYQDLLRAG
jgi:predicted GNAT family acetyltransferase